MREQAPIFATKAHRRNRQPSQEPIAFCQQPKRRVDGKVKAIVRDPSSQQNTVSFEYDAMGNRIAKHISDPVFNVRKSTYYVLDAQGNTISTYDWVVDDPNQIITYEQTEKHIYGSSRLGALNEKVPMLASQNTTYSQDVWTHTIGERTYEISNHLGNVLSVISDKPIPHDSSGTANYYLADIRVSQDYSPFGVTLKDRGGTLSGAEDYRYGFQGQEMDDEIKGKGNSVNYKYRMHDPRVGRFFAVDPLSSDYPWQSPYVFAGNSPLMFAEKLGMSIDPVRKKFYLEMGSASITSISHRNVAKKANKYKALYMVAQRRMENGFNSSPPGNNPFNVKGTGDAGSVTYGTHEYENGKRVNQNASFANYSSLDVGISAFLDVLESNFSNAYSALLSDSKTAQDYSKGLMNGRLGVYATDPDYEEKFTNMLEGVVSDFDEMLNSSLKSLNENLKSVNDQITGLEKKEDKSYWDYGEMILLNVQLGVIEDAIKDTKANVNELNKFKKNEGIE